MTNSINKVNYEYFVGNEISGYDIVDKGKWSSPFNEVEIE